MNTGTFPQEPVLLEDRYPAKLLRVEEYEKTYDGETVPKLAWIFGVKADDSAIDPDIEYEAEREGLLEIAAHTSFATGPNSTFTKLGFPAFVGDDWDGNTDSLIGKTCIADVTNYETKGGQTRNVIEKVRPQKKGKGKTEPSASKRDPVDPNEEDFDDIPF